MLKGQNGVKGMWRRISPYEWSDGLWHKRVQQLSIFPHFFVYDFTNNLFEPPFFAERQKKTKPRVDQF